MMAYEIVILEEQGTACEFAIDDIYWSGGPTTTVTDADASLRDAVLLSNVPNPFKSGTELRFLLPAAGPYALGVYDVTGKRVAGFSGIGRAGENRLHWSGRNDQGREVRPGVYWYRLDTDRSSQGRRIVRLE